MTHGSLLKNRRRELGLTQGGLAKKAGVSRSTIVRIEREIETSTLESIKRSLAEALDIEISNLFPEANS